MTSKRIPTRADMAQQLHEFRGLRKLCRQLDEDAEAQLREADKLRIRNANLEQLHHKVHRTLEAWKNIFQDAKSELPRETVDALLPVRGATQVLLAALTGQEDTNAGLGQRALDLAIASLLGYRPDPITDMRWRDADNDPIGEEDIPHYSLDADTANAAARDWLVSLPEKDRDMASAVLKTLRPVRIPGTTEAEHLCISMLHAHAMLQAANEILARRAKA